MSAKNNAHKSVRDVIGSVALTAVHFDGAVRRACRFIFHFASACAILIATSQYVIAAGDVERRAQDDAGQRGGGGWWGWGGGGGGGGVVFFFWGGGGEGGGRGEKEKSILQ